MRTYTYLEIGINQPTVTGNAMDLGVAPLQTKNPYHVIEGVTNFGSPLPCLTFLPEEGVDSPIYSRDSTAEELPSAQFKWKRRKDYQRVLMSTDDLGIPYPIYEAPPDTTPIFVAKFLEYPADKWERIWVNKKLLAGIATLPTQGFWGERVPARTYTTSSCRMLEEIQRHMLEPVIDSGVSWSLWTQTEVLGYVNQRIAKFLTLTSILTERVTITVPFSNTNATLPADVLEVRRVAWEGQGLVRSDVWVQDQGNSGWDQTTGTPFAYIEDAPFSIRLVPTPALTGTLDVLYVPMPALVTGACVNLPFPNMLTPYLKYGVMADMFAKQGEANDPQRAAYCEQRFQEGVIMAKLLLGVQ